MRLHISILARSSLGLALSAALVLSSCGKLDHMQDNMDQTVKNTADMKELTCRLLVAATQGGAHQSRDDDLTFIRAAKDINEKLDKAAAYMFGFQYFIWSPQCAAFASRDTLIEQAASEILTGVEPYAKNRSKVTATKGSSDYETLYALAATLHKVNSVQDAYLQGSSEKPMRPLDIIIQGLKLNQAKNRGRLMGANFPVWATTVGKYADDAVFLLRLRANFLMAYGYAVADSDTYGDTPNFFDKLWRVSTTKIFGKKWTPNLDNRDPTSIRERITTSLELAKETRDALVGLGFDPMVDKTVLKVWKDADFSKFDLTAMEKGMGDAPERAKSIRELIQARDLLLTDGTGRN